MKPSYIESYNNGLLKNRSDKAFEMLKSCSLCPRKCKVNRLNNELGFCKTADKPVVYSYMLHHGEEPAISGTRGSGTVFFSNCNMNCVYCQNYRFSQKGEGSLLDEYKLSDIMLELQNSGCHNINFVSPTHVMPWILKALLLAVPKGLKVPIVYNTGGYELPEIISMLDGIIDIYLVDMRYSDNDMSKQFSNCPDYPYYNQASVKVMFEQQHNAIFDSEGMIQKGMIIRHLVLPEGISGTEKIMDFISKELSKDVYVSLMSQYFPEFQAKLFKQISRRIYFEEYDRAINIMHEKGIYHGWTQEDNGLMRFAGVNIKRNIF